MIRRRNEARGRRGPAREQGGAGKPPAERKEDATDGGREFARWLFAQDCEFVAGTAGPDRFPDPGLPEVAFAGRSNVGKSSLINALAGRRRLARISNAPGRTQQINFFSLGGRLMLVDLPGYGYARAAKFQIEAWTRLVEIYLERRSTLRRLCLLVDARHGLKKSDRDLMAMLDGAAVSYQVVLTKADKVKPTPLARLMENLGAELAAHAAAHPGVIATSARQGRGVDELRTALATVAAGAQLD